MSRLSVTFDQPLGERLADGGYHLDFRVKARDAHWPPPYLEPLDKALWVAKLQWALGALERHLHGDGDEWLAGAQAVGAHVLDRMASDGALMHLFDYPHTFRLPAPWPSAMAQGEAASLLVRLHRAGGDAALADAARQLLAPIRVHSRDGGCGVPWEGGWWPEEYPTDPPSYVLNGGLFAIFGMWDVADALGDAAARQDFDRARETLLANLARWEIGGWWTRYDLYPHRVPNIASLAYQELHATQLRALDRIAPDPRLSVAAERYERERASVPRRAAAFTAKVAFRLLVPRR